MDFITELPIPQPRASTRDYNLIARELRNHPGQWAEIQSKPDTSKGNDAGGIQGRLLARGPGFHTTQRVVDGQKIVYARWMPPKDADLL